MLKLENAQNSAQNAAIQEEIYNDKSMFYLPRQCLMQAVKALILLDFLEINQKFTPYLYLWKTESVIKM